MIIIIVSLSLCVLVASYHVGASRPVAQWDTPWTNASDFFAWTRTGQSLQPVSHHFAPDSPKLRPDFNCVSILFIRVWTQQGVYGILTDTDCDTQTRFICERV